MFIYIKTPTIFVGVIYLCAGLAASIFPAMLLLAAPKDVLFAAQTLIFFGTLLLIYGPCFFIAYAWIRGRKWGWYLLIAYNGLWFAIVSYTFASRLINYSESHLALVVTAFLGILAVLGGLIVFAFQEDVRAFMTR